jgi:ketosteroid isomerase-like protein
VDASLRLGAAAFPNSVTERELRVLGHHLRRSGQEARLCMESDCWFKARDTAPAMSEENVELARRIQGAWNDRDLEAMRALADPEIEYVNSPTAVEPGTRHGYEGLTIVLETQWEMLTSARLEIARTYDRGEEVIVLSLLSREMPGSEDRIEAPNLFSYKFRDGKLIRVEALALGSVEVQEALQAAGLSE